MYKDTPRKARAVGFVILFLRDAPPGGWGQERSRVVWRPTRFGGAPVLPRRRTFGAGLPSVGPVRGSSFC